jgi:hypothetical protein
MIPVYQGLAPRREQVIALLSQHLPEWRRLYGIQDLAL